MAFGDNTGYILSIFGFYVFLGVLLGLVGSSFLPSEEFEQPTEGFSVLTAISYVGYFFSGLFFSISSIPAWANVILFLPLSITLLYILVTLVLELIPG